MSAPGLVVLTGVPRDYAWGSRTAIQDLLGVEPDGRPLAELWFGAHPHGPSAVPALDTSLDELIAGDPAGILGGAVADRFGVQLPFLLKLLAADSALSIQVHPTLAQARAGYARENAAGLGAGDPARNYRDPNHKPELLCALTDFLALCGFRPVRRTLALLDALGLPELGRLRELLAGPDGLRAAFTYLLALPDPEPLVAAVHGASGSLGPEWADVATAVQDAYHDFPGDVGVMICLLLNAVRLAPGEAIYLGAGNVHAYLRGLGVEIMANSDNVLRCGLTPKHVDEGELLRITDFSELDDPRRPAEPMASPDGAPGLIRMRYPVPVADFALERFALAGGSPVEITGDGPVILLCTAGACRIGSGDDAATVSPGSAVFVPAGSRTLRLSGPGTLFAASVGDLRRSPRKT